MRAVEKFLWKFRKVYMKLLHTLALVSLSVKFLVVGLQHYYWAAPAQDIAALDLWSVLYEKLFNVVNVSFLFFFV